MRPSRATIVAPAEGPNSNTEVKTNVSEIEIVAGTEGSFTVAEPLSSVRAARMIHCGPKFSSNTWMIEWAMIAEPVSVTAPT